LPALLDLLRAFVSAPAASIRECSGDPALRRGQLSGVVGDPQLVVDLAYLKFCGTEAEARACSDLRVGLSVCQVFDYFDFTGLEELENELDSLRALWSPRRPGGSTSALRTIREQDC
jgi:hypothetical protein